MWESIEFFGEIIYMAVVYLLYGIPLLSLISLAVCLYRFCHAKKANKRKPESFSDKDIRSRKRALIITSVIAAIFWAVILAIVIILYIGLQNM